MITSEDGKYEFSGLPAGKYSLSGAKRGFISGSYDQHDQFSTAIVTGAGLDTETLVLRLAPDAVIAGKVLDEAGDPVRHATVTLYYDDHSSGVDQIRQFRSAQTDDLGEYELTPLRPGAYFLSASGKPWYAVHPPSEPGYSESDGQAEAARAVDRSLDVAYPVTYYPDVDRPRQRVAYPDPRWRTRGGGFPLESRSVSPLACFDAPDGGNHAFFFRNFSNPLSTVTPLFRLDVIVTASPALVEMTGIPAGRYNLRPFGPGQRVQMNGVDLTKDGEEVDISKGEVSSSVKVSLQIPDEAGLPPQLTVGLRSGSREVGASRAGFQGRAELQQSRYWAV